MAQAVQKGAKLRSKRTPLARFVIRTGVTFLAVGLIAVISGVGYIFSMSSAMEPQVAAMGDKIREVNSKPSRILSADGKLLYENKPVYRENVSLSELPRHLKLAMLAAEDKRFYYHPGFDTKALARASVNVLSNGEASQGGSTLNMQLAKRLFSSSEKSMKRKVQDIAIAIQMDKQYTKDQILEMYFNQVYYGEQAYGIAAAAEIYFDKKVEKLTLSESAMLSRCVRIPTSQNPVRDYQVSITNRNVVLKTMLDEKWITQSEYDKAVEERPVVRKKKETLGGRIYAAPYFVAGVIRQVRELGIDLSVGGYTVHTTLDSQLQEYAEAATRRTIRQNRGMRVNTAAFVAADSEGRILADVGGLDYERSQFSYTRQSKLQPGSAFKPFVYAEALKQGLLTEYSSISNRKVVIKGMGSGGKAYIPRSHGGGDEVSLRSAMAQSINIPAVRTLQMLGFRKGAELITSDFGFKTELKAVPSLALGSVEVRPMELVQAYSVFALNGQRIKPYDIQQIINGEGEEEYVHTRNVTNTRLGPAVINTMDRLLRAVVTEGTGKSAGGVPEARGKTGTTNEGKSVWFCGYSKGVVGIAWAGNEFYDKKRKRWLLASMPESYGGDVAAPLWANVMGEAIKRFGNDVKPKFEGGEEDEREAGDGSGAIYDEDRAERAERRRRRRQERENEIPTPVVDLSPDREPNTNRDEPDKPAVDPIRDGGGNEDENPPRENPPKEDPPVKTDDDAANDRARERERAREEQREKAKEREREKARERAKEKDNAESSVSVNVCADSGALAGSYCPSTISREYPRSRRPKGRCKLHKPPEEGGGGDGHR